MKLKLTPDQKKLFDLLPEGEWVMIEDINKLTKNNYFHNQGLYNTLQFFRSQGLIEFNGKYGNEEVRRRTQKEIIQFMQNGNL